MQPRLRPSLANALFSAAMLGVQLLVLVACSESSTSESQSLPANSIETVAYTVRGIVAELPDSEIPTSMFKVRHEPMPHYRRPDGTLGMNAMTMPFPPAAGLSLEGLEVGQKIELTFEVDYDPQNGSVLSLRATGVDLLPEETELNFSNADPDGPAETS